MSNPMELVRVKDPATGAEFNATRQYASRAGFTVTTKDTHDRYGRPIPSKTDPLKPRSASTPAQSPTKKTGKTAEKES